MRVRYGWSGELRSGTWEKIDIELDETDLERILLTAGLSHLYPTAITTIQAYMVLDTEAALLLTAKVAQRCGSGDENERIEALKRKRTGLIDCLRLSGCDQPGDQ
jgi:hypothetical protein